MFVCAHVWFVVYANVCVCTIEYVCTPNNFPVSDTAVDEDFACALCIMCVHMHMHVHVHLCKVILCACVCVCLPMGLLA